MTSLMPLFLFLTLYSLQVFASPHLEACPQSVKVSVQCEKSGSKSNFMFLGHEAIYRLDVEKSLESHKLFKNEEILRCLYTPIQTSADISGWMSSYKINNITYEDIHDINVIKAFIAQQISLEDLPQRNYLTANPFLELHYNINSETPELYTQILFTGFEYMMTRSEMMGLKSEDPELLAVIQKNFSNTQYSENDYFFTASSCQSSFEVE